jgi:Flp pilus assembly protein TadD
VKALAPPDNLHFDAVQGWLMLGDPASAREELAQLSPAARLVPEVLELEWALHAETQSWREALEAAQRLIAVAPDRASGWIHRAYARRRVPGGGLDQAWADLRPAHDRFPRNYLIAFNLACYAAQMGRPDEAWDWLARAVGLGGRDGVVPMALADRDLEPLWPRIRNELKTK